MDIPYGVETIGYDAFEYCENLSIVTIPESVTYIGSWAFNGCNLTNITIPESVTEIGYAAFDEEVTIYCKENSTAQTFAIESGYTYYTYN